MNIKLNMLTSLTPIVLTGAYMGKQHGNKVIFGDHLGQPTVILQDMVRSAKILNKPKKASEIDASNYIAKYGSAAE
jgi:hypothetical protein